MRTFILYDERVLNSDGTRILLQGLKLNRFKKNPVMLYMHHRAHSHPQATGSEVIGRWKNIRIHNQRLLAEAQFDTQDPFAKKIAQKVQQGFLIGASIGIEVTRSTDDSKYKLKGQHKETIIESVLLEASIVDIPKNENALMKSKGQLAQHQNQCFAYEEQQHGEPYKMSLKKNTAETSHTTSGSEENLQNQVTKLKKELQEVKDWKKTFLNKLQKELTNEAQQEGWIQTEEKNYCEKLFAQDFELGKQFLQLQKQYRKQHTPPKLHHFLEKVKQQQTNTLHDTSDYKTALKHHPERLKELKNQDPQRFRSLIEKHLLIKRKKQKADSARTP